MQGFLPPVIRSTNNNLTNREKEVLVAIAEGLSGKKAACKLHIALATLKAHKSSIHSKLDLHSIAALVCYAVQAGLVKPRSLHQQSAAKHTNIP